jgi:DNA-binding response OmpR family regulator
MKTILVADDDDKRIVAALMARLVSAGYQVLTASNGLKAVRVARDTKPDLILLDVWMPHGMGISVAECLRGHGVQTPIIFLTASKKPGLWAAAQEVGADGYFEKPFATTELLTAIHETLARSP